MTNNDWEEVKTTPPPREKQCEGENCIRTFMAKWPGERRCERCRKEKRPYKDPNNPF